ncbi:zinc-dependent alcohol dehydrogenase family protein [Alphaproteobacteria bacterium]|nr:zinc-dependent alcohol dehydrogenase family protein [Alphaproteobacteria bacterium]
MYRVQFDKIGKASEQVYLKKVDNIKTINENEVLIEVIYFPINPADILLVEGKYANKPKLPSLIGAECIAKVKKVGKYVKKFKLDDIVLPLVRNNWVEEKVVTENEIIKLPNNIDTQQACMLKVNPATAYLMLNNYVKVKQGDFIVQNASNSSVGNYVIQLAKLYDINTINLVRRKEVIATLKDYGADYVFKLNLNQKEESFIESSNPKLFIDAVAGEYVNTIASLLTDNSTIINYGLLSGKNIQLDPHNTIFKNIILKGFWLSLWLNKMSIEEKVKLYSYLSELIIRKVLFTKVEKVFNIKDIKEAINAASNFNRDGKILVTTSKA